MMKALEEKQIKIEKLYGFTRYLLIEINNGYWIVNLRLVLVIFIKFIRLILIYFIR